MKKISLFILLSGFFLGTVEGQNSPPNIIVILTDDQGYADVGFNGSAEIPTPHIDRIASNGTVVTNGYVSYAVCGPSRAGLITGRYQDRFGFSRNSLIAPKDSTMGLPQYDLHLDLREKRNLHSEKPAASDRLQGLIKAWNETLEIPRFLGLMQDKEYSRHHPDRYNQK